MPISVCQESVQHVFNHTLQVVNRQRHISISQGLFLKHLLLRLNHLLSPAEVFFAWPKRQLPLQLLILPRLPLRVVPIPSATAVCCSVTHRAWSVVWSPRHLCVRRQPAWQHPTAKAVVILTAQK